MNYPDKNITRRTIVVIGHWIGVLASSLILLELISTVPSKLPQFSEYFDSRLVAWAMVSVNPGTAHAASAPTPTDVAKKLNTEGFRLYKQKKYPEALELFSKAVEADSGFAPAHFNLACTSAVVRKKLGVCPYTPLTYKDTIVEHLNEAVRLDPALLSKVKSDPDLKPVHDMYGYQTLIGLSPEKPQNMRTILSRVTWYGPYPSRYGPDSGIRFHQNGTLAFWHFIHSADREIRGRKNTIRGTYTLEKNKIRVELKSPYNGNQVYHCTLLSAPFSDEPAGVISCHNPPEEYLSEGEFERFSDDPGECDNRAP